MVPLLYVLERFSCVSCATALKSLFSDILRCCTMLPWYVPVTNSIAERRVAVMLGIGHRSSDPYSITYINIARVTKSSAKFRYRFRWIRILFQAIHTVLVTFPWSSTLLRTVPGVGFAITRFFRFICFLWYLLNRRAPSAASRSC